MEIDNPVTPEVTPEESIDVPSSEEITEETPVVETPSDEPVVEEPEVPTEPELYELPDGRQVDAATLATEWKDNFSPDYTRKSQELADIKRGNDLPTETPADSNPFNDPEYVPKNYQEVIEAAKTQIRSEDEQTRSQEATERQATEDAVVTQLTEIKESDPDVNENQLFLHATKYGFRDLKMAHTNMKAMGDITKTVQKQTAENIKKRNDPVSVVPGASGAQSDPRDFSSAVDFMRSLNT